MSLQYINVPENDFGRGIDARSTENQIGEGFVRDLLNADVIQKSVRKRTGYESYAGNIPVRATRLDYIASKQQMCLTLDSVVSLNTSISLESVRSSPLVIYGRKSNASGTGTGPITTTDSAHYYSKFLVPIRKELVAPSGTLNVPGTEHGLGTTQFFCNVVQSTSLLNKSYEDVDTHSIRVDSASYDVNIDYTVASTTDAIVYYKNETSVPGDNYLATLSHSGSPAIQSFSVPTTTHNLINYNIIYQLYQDTGSEWVQVKPNEFLVQPNGDISVTIINDTGSSVSYKLILAASPTANLSSGVVNSSSTGTVVISGLDSPWLFYNIYLEQTAGGTKEEVLADSVIYNDVTKEVTLQFTNLAPVSRNFTIYYQYGDIRSNVLCVEDAAVTVNGTDYFPQITIWGLDHSEIYSTKSAREGWTTHIDTYRRSAEQRVIAGLGGNLFSAQTYSEAAAQYLYANLYPSLQSRAASALRVGPLFYDTGDNPQRSRGYITTDMGGTAQVSVSAVEYDSVNGWTKYTLAVPNMNIVGTLSTMISTVSGLEDWLTVNNMSYKRHEGTFRIKDVAQGIDQLEIWVENAQNNSSDWDDLNTGGYAGVYTDQINWLSTCSYIPNDTLILVGNDLAQVYSSDDSTTVCGPFDSINQIPAGVLVTGRRTSELIPMREALPSLADSVSNLVRGDMISYTGANRHLRVLSINADSDRTISISSDGETATVTLASGDTTYLSSGQKVLLIGAGNYSGVQTISNILSATQFIFSTTYNDSISSAILSGKTVEVDEKLEWSDTSGDSTIFQVARRWIPIEAPDDNFNLTPSTHVRYFDSAQYSAQPFIRSTMVADNLYLTNSSDEVMKFDGQNIYRAGLPAWQPGLFVTQSINPTSRTCTISSGSNIITTASTAGIEIGAVVADGGAIPSGATVISVTSPTSFTISLPATGNATTTVSFTIPRIVVNLKQVGYKNKIADAGTLELTQNYETSVLPIGTTVRLSGSTQIYTIQGYKTDSNHIIFDRSLDSTVAATGTVTELGKYKYYFRLNAVDANDNIIASAMTSSDDMTAEMTDNAAIHLKLIGLPTFDNYDYDRLEVQIYRTKLLTGTTAPVFYLITTLPLNFNNTTGYIEYTDTFSDSDLYQLDQTSSIAGAELGINWSEPLRAKYITTTANRLVLGNVTDYPEMDIQLVGPANLANGQIASAGNGMLFRKNSADIGTVTNMVDRVKFEWKSADATKTTSTFSVGTDEFSFIATGISGAVIGDWIYLYYSTPATTGRLLNYAGWWQISNIVGTTVTVKLTGATASTSYPDRYMVATNSRNVPVVLGIDGNLGQSNGDTFDIFDATRRLALAINAVMRQVDVTISGMQSFSPWLLARSGDDLSAAGKLIVRATKVEDYLPSLVPTYSNYSLYVNSLPVASGQSAVAVQRVYPSRILVSYQNYPELFDSPTTILDSDSISAIDINPADGQEITGVIPFFGEAAFTAAQQAGILVVFKTNSIYLVDINQKVSGSNLVVQRLETQGLGCTAPYSISVTKNGIMFANNSGIYCLRRNQAIEYIGKFMERNWVNRVDRNVLSLAQGHHYGVGRMYKLSVPISGTEDTATGYIEPSEVYVYNHTQEDEENHLGAWSRYDNHSAIGWANLASDAFWASTGGKVYVLRATGSETDFRDSNQPIVFRLDTRPNDYGNSGIRKVLDKVVASYRTGNNTASNNMYFSVDLEQEYSATTSFRVAGSTENLTGFDDEVKKDIITLRHSLDRRKGVYFSIRIENNNLDENVEIAGVDYRVGGLDSKGIKSASKT